MLLPPTSQRCRYGRRTNIIHGGGTTMLRRTRSLVAVVSLAWPACGRLPDWGRSVQIQGSRVHGTGTGRSRRHGSMRRTTDIIHMILALPRMDKSRDPPFLHLLGTHPRLSRSPKNLAFLSDSTRSLTLSTKSCSIISIAFSASVISSRPEKSCAVVVGGPCS